MRIAWTLALIFLAPWPLFAENPADRITSKRIELTSEHFVVTTRVIVRYRKNGTGVILWNVDGEGLYFQGIDRERNLIPGTRRHLKSQYAWDFMLDGKDLVLLVVKREGMARFDNADNTKVSTQLLRQALNSVQLVRLKPSGKERFRKKIIGHEGGGKDTLFNCQYSGAGRLGFDGSRYSVFTQICINIGTERKPDIHETDYFVQLDGRGRTIDGTAVRITSSHSFMNQLVVGRGEAYTATIGDVNPYGLTVSGYRKGKRQFKVIPYPEQERLPYTGMTMYKRISSTADAGYIGGLIDLGKHLITVMATVENKRHPTKKQARDLLFIKLDKQGNVIQRKWLAPTPRVSEFVPYIVPYKGNILLLYADEKKINPDYDGRANLAVLDKNGAYVIPPRQIDVTINSASQFFTYPNGDIGWTTPGMTRQVTLYRLRL